MMGRTWCRPIAPVYRYMGRAVDPYAHLPSLRDSLARSTAGYVGFTSHAISCRRFATPDSASNSRLADAIGRDHPRELRTYVDSRPRKSMRQGDLQKKGKNLNKCIDFGQRAVLS